MPPDLGHDAHPTHLQMRQSERGMLPVDVVLESAAVWQEALFCCHRHTYFQLESHEDRFVDLTMVPGGYLLDLASHLTGLRVISDLILD